MVSPATDHPLLIWTDGDRAELIEALLARLPGVVVQAVGGPSRAGLPELAERFGSESQNDPRRLLLDHPGAAVLLGTSRGIGAELLGQAIAAGTVILAIEPLPFALPPLPRTPSGGQGGVALFPWFRLSPAWKSAVEAPKALGQITSVAFSALCPHGQLSLFAQLYGAMDLLLDLLGPADTVDASLTGPLVEAPEDVTALTGDLSAHLRFADRAAATIQLSDRAGQWRRRLVAIGTEGQLTLEDDTYQLLGPSGQILDEVMAGSKPAVEPAALMGYQWQHLVDRLANPDPSDPAQLLASCQATVLSCRTGQLESPRRLMELYGA